MDRIKNGLNYSRSLLSGHRLIPMLLALVLAFGFVACKPIEDSDADPTVEPTAQQTTAPTADGNAGTTTGPIEIPSGDRLTPPITTALPEDLRIIRDYVPPRGALRDALHIVREDILVQDNLFDMLINPYNSDALFEVALYLGQSRIADIDMNEERQLMQNHAKWLAGNGIKVKWGIQCDDINAYYYFYGYLSPEQILNFPDARPEFGYTVNFLLYFSSAYNVPLENFDRWE